MYEPVTPHKAALRVYHKIRNDPQPRLFMAHWIEGKAIPEGTFNEFVHECKGMGLCIHKYVAGRSVTMSGY